MKKEKIIAGIKFVIWSFLFLGWLYLYTEGSHWGGILGMWLCWTGYELFLKKP